MKWVVCTECLERCAPQEEVCHICGHELEMPITVPESYLTELEEQDNYVRRETNPDDDPMDIFREVQPSSAWCLGCEQKQGCTCTSESDKLPLMEVQEDVFDAHVDAYDPSAICDNCIFVFSGDCEPYRKWLIDWALIGPDPDKEKISGCDQYRSI